MPTKICPLVALQPLSSDSCLEDRCAMFNDHLGVCGLIATGLLRALDAAADERLREET